MSEIEALEAQLKQLKDKALGTLPKSSGWFSRKLITVLVLAGSLVFLGREQIANVIVGLVWLGIAYLAAQGIVDAVREWKAGSLEEAKTDANARIRIALIEASAKDGFDATEREALTPRTEKQKA